MAVLGTGIISSRGQVNILPRIVVPDAFVYTIGFDIAFDVFTIADADKIGYVGTVDSAGQLSSINFPLFDVTDDLGLASWIGGGASQTDSTQGNFELFTTNNPYWISYFGSNVTFDLFTSSGRILGPQITADVTFPTFEVDDIPYLYVDAAFNLFTGAGSIGEYRINADVSFPLFTGEGEILDGYSLLSIDSTIALFDISQEISADVVFPTFEALNEYPAYLVTGVAWCNNIRFEDGPETTKFENFNFLHIIRLGDAYYGIKSDGLYQLGGQVDGAAAIDASFSIASNNLEDLHFKRCVYMYLDSQDTTMVSPVVDGITYGPYPAGFNSRRVIMGRGITGVTWGFDVTNVGNPIKINRIESAFETLSRRVA